METPVQNSIPQRDPALVMRLNRIGSMHQCRLSFMRVLTRRLAKENWSFARPVFDVDAKGVGHAVYTATGPVRTYSLVAFAHDLPPEMRSDRVIATAWDATFTLFDGMPTAEDIERLSKNVPYQEAGRVNEKSLSVSRANRSVRLWEYMVDALSKGEQPDAAKVASVGYLMRTTAVYGSGKLGAADHETIADRPEFDAPFQAEMLSVFLTRAFVRDMINHLAHARGGDQATELAPEIAHGLGIGNSTGLGMAPFLINHPVLLNNWVAAREEAIARVRSLNTVTEAQANLFRSLFARVQVLVKAWRSEHPVQIKKLDALKADLDQIASRLNNDDLTADAPWDRLLNWTSEALSEEGQELIASLILEPYGDLVDNLSSAMSDHRPDAFRILGSMSVAALRDLMRGTYGWALETDWSAQENCARAWYVSEEKLEPRLGERFEEPIADYEQPLAPGRDVARAFENLKTWDASTPIAEFLLKHPEHRHSIRRVQINACAPYSEIQDNTICADMMPIDMLRYKLATFGATHFDPRSDRWVRICMFGNAPYPEELTNENADFWVYPDGEGRT
ncbi:hypothetical protein [Halocynthiibacter styelae]|uniref:Uncharacterized protein n=1 Tax=Halocynthiibacter styelae TaxID=2761955 RepID=A0A8J7J4J3_9RHOB|nr:hypothetical protein [Paenihalocynthiibacter styelae]MBI1493185.1 hypothetical protein [Paenihalocynthiibacter styelae]